nr:hypothetical protein [Tanacetum cinerariifolium]
MPHPLTSSSSSSAHSQSHDQEEVDSVSNYELDPIEYYDQLPPIPRASAEFKQTRGMFKFLGHFLSNFGKKKKNAYRSLLDKRTSTRGLLLCFGILCRIPKPFALKARTLCKRDLGLPEPQ